MMGSKGRAPPSLVGRPIPGPAMLQHPEPFAGLYPQPGHMPFEVLPSPEVMEQKLAMQDKEMQRLATENQRLAATHSTLRQDLVGAQQELQRLHSHMDAMKFDQDGEIRSILDKMDKIEVDLRAADQVKQELQLARTEAQGLVATRQELTTKALQLTQELQRSHNESQQIRSLMVELESLRQEYEHCRTTYEYERKIKNEHLESLNVMERNYVSMSREVEKLRAELTAMERRIGGAYGDAGGYKESSALGDRPGRQNAFEDGYGSSRGWGGPAGGGATGSVQGRAGYEGGRDAGYDMARGNIAYEVQRGGPGYDPTKGIAVYETQRGPGYEAERGGAGYDAAKAGYGYAPQRGYEGLPSRGPGGGQMPHASANAGSQVPPSNPGAVGHEDLQRSNNQARK